MRRVKGRDIKMTERKRSSIFRRLSFLPSKGTANGVWQVNSEADLGLDASPAKPTPPLPEQKRRVRTLERLPSEMSDLSRYHGSSSAERPERINTETDVNSIAARSNGSFYSANSDRSRRPMSPMRRSLPSTTSSERSSSKRASHIQLVPKSMINPQSPPISTEDLRRLEKELIKIGAKERRARSSTADGDRPTSRAGSDSERPRSETSTSSSGRVRIQYIPRSSITLEQEQQESPTVLPVIGTVSEHKTRINRSLTAVTEETRMNSEYHSDIEEEDEDEN